MPGLHTCKMSKTFDTPSILLDPELYSKWLAKLCSYDLDNGDSAIKNIVSALYGGEICSIVDRFSGSYNFCFQVHFEAERNDAIIRFPIQGAVRNPSQMVEDGAFVMRYIKEKTSVPIPTYYTHGIASGEFDGLGPYLVMEFIPGTRLDELLCTGDCFKAAITETQLNKVYEQIATMYLQINSLDFDQIGRLSWNEEPRQWIVKPDPLMIKQNELGAQIPSKYKELLHY